MKKRVLFLDRDGTLVKEPPEDYQLDSLEKLEFIPGVFRNLYRIRQHTPYEMVLVSNQDGLGTDSFPMEDHLPPHEKFLTAFRNEGVEFDAEHIDPSMPEENSPNRKPRTGMLEDYFGEAYDLDKSFVVGDRRTDMELARNLGARGIYYAPGKCLPEDMKDLEGVVDLVSDDWDEIYLFLRASLRQSSVSRTTSETDIRVKLSLDGQGKSKVSTGLGFFDHMLDQLGKHGGFNLELDAKGDLHVDEHHTMEDTALALGQAFREALGDKRGVERYAFTLPMDDSLATVAVDFGGRPWLVWDVDFRGERIGDVSTGMFFHFFKSFSDAAACNLNIRAEGDNDHHRVEAIFKAFARALRQAVKLDADDDSLPTTKGKL